MEFSSQEVETTYKTTKWGEVWFVKDVNGKSFRFAIYRYFDDKTNVYLSNVFVSKKYRGRGLGNCILDSAYEIAKKLEAQKMLLKVKNGSFAYEWYKRHGFSYFSDEDTEYIWMYKDIK